MLVTPPPHGSVLDPRPVAPSVPSAVGPRDGVRQAVAEDAQGIAFVQAASHAEAFAQRLVPQARPLLDFHAEVRSWSSRIARGALPVLVALRGGAVVGYVALDEPRGVMDSAGIKLSRVQSAHTLPQHWTGRVPENLCVSAQDWLVQHRYESLHVSVVTENAAVQWFLTQNGFRMAGASFVKGRQHTRYVRAL